MKLWSIFFAAFLAISSLWAQEPEPTDQSVEKFFFSSRKFAKRHHWYWGAGAVVSDIPVIKSRFSIPFSQILYEYNLSDPNKTFHYALGGGFYGLNAILPVPVFQPSFYWGSENSPIMARFSAGAFSDVIVGGHSGVLFSAGVVIKNRIDISLVIVPFGTQPVLPYPEIVGSLEEEMLDTATVSYNKDPFGEVLNLYDEKGRHQDDDQFDSTSTKYYSQYDIDYGNGEWSRKGKAHPGDFDYIEGREYISFPYFGILITFRH